MSIVAPVQIKPLAVKLKAETALQPIVTPVANPCWHGCGYAPANCTSFAAIMRERAGYPVGDNWHDARDWPANAAAQGIELGSTPIVGAVAISRAGAWGHAMYVEAVYPTGGFMVIEQNYDFLGSIRERFIGSPAGLTFIYF